MSSDPTERVMEAIRREMDPDGYWCPECGRPSLVGLPDEVCVDCGGFDWDLERQRKWSS